MHNNIYLESSITSGLLSRDVDDFFCPLDFPASSTFEAHDLRFRLLVFWRGVPEGFAFDLSSFGMVFICELPFPSIDFSIAITSESGSGGGGAFVSGLALGSVGASGSTSCTSASGLTLRTFN